MHRNSLGASWEEVLLSIDTMMIDAPPASVDSIASRYKSPFHVLVSTILSLRTRDAVTLDASERLFQQIGTAKELAQCSIDHLSQVIYPVGFYKTKAKNLKKIAEILIKEYAGLVPRSRKELLALPGVGLKTANLVLSAGFSIPAICVDIHVHRIANRLGFVATLEPDKTEEVLRKTLPPQFWMTINQTLVRFGQGICKPTRPLCPLCTIRAQCPHGRQTTNLTTQG